MAGKSYRLVRGTHDVPNPDFIHGSDSPSHFQAKVGDIVELNDDQFKAFKDKFKPLESEAASLRDLDDQELEDAKKRALLTGEAQNPNPRSN